MNSEVRYPKARKLLESKFEQKHKIALAYVNKVTNGPAIKAEDAEALEGFTTFTTVVRTFLKLLVTPVSLKARIACGR